MHDVEIKYRNKIMYHGIIKLEINAHKMYDKYDKQYTDNIFLNYIEISQAAHNLCFSWVFY